MSPTAEILALPSWHVSLTFEELESDEVTGGKPESTSVSYVLRLMSRDLAIAYASQKASRRFGRVRFTALTVQEVES